MLGSFSDVKYGWYQTQYYKRFMSVFSRLQVPDFDRFDSSGRKNSSRARGDDRQIKGSFISWWRRNVVTMLLSAPLSGPAFFLFTPPASDLMTTTDLTMRPGRVFSTGF